MDSDTADNRVLEDVFTSNAGVASPAVLAAPPSRRACKECKRKKTKCDMRRPACSLCTRIGHECIYLPFTPRPAQMPGQWQRRQGRLHSKEKLLGALDDVFPLPRAPSNQAFFTIDRVLSLLEFDAPRHLSVGGSPSSILAARSSSTIGASLHDDLHSSHGAFSNFVPQSMAMVDAFSPIDSSANLISFDESQFQNCFPPNEFQMPGPPQQSLGDSDLLSDNTSVGDFNYGSGTTAQSLILNAAEGSSTDPSSLSLGTYQNEWMPISTALANHLLDVFFDRIQCFVPLFHMPSFKSKFMAGTDDSQGHLTNLSTETAFVFNVMFALSARFSNSIHFSGVEPTERGEAFAKRAEELFERQQISEGNNHATLPMLQGCILLANYHLASGVTSRAWILIGICVRMAYELRLHEVDQHVIVDNYQQTDLEWVSNEEKRRAWWSSWELDHFASAITSRPYGCDRNQVDVLLPVSDRAWFRNTPVPSTPLRTDHLTTWNTLEGSLNQDERAWFLVLLQLIRLVTELFHNPRRASSQMQKGLETSLTCFALALPSKFNLSSVKPLFDNDNRTSSCWIITTQILLQGAHILCSLWKSKNKVLNGAGESDCGSQMDRSSLGRFQANTSQVILALRSWAPEYMPFTPLLAPTILGPHAINVQNCLLCFSEDDDMFESSGSGLDIEILKLSLKRYAWYWKTGNLVLDVVRVCSSLTDRNFLSLPPDEKESLRSFPLIAPSWLRSEMMAKVP